MESGVPEDEYARLEDLEAFVAALRRRTRWARYRRAVRSYFRRRMGWE